MRPHTFLRLLLLLPLVVPLLVGSVELARRYAGVPMSGELTLNALVLWGSLWFGGVSYLITAALLWVRIGRCKSRKSVMVLVFTAPLFFIPLQFIAMLLLSLLLPSVEASFGDKVTNGFLLGLWTGVYGLIFGYFYATCSAAIFLGAVRVGLVSRFSSVEPCFAEKSAA